MLAIAYVACCLNLGFLICTVILAETLICFPFQNLPKTHNNLKTFIQISYTPGIKSTIELIVKQKLASTKYTVVFLPLFTQTAFCHGCGQ